MIIKRAAPPPTPASRTKDVPEYQKIYTYL